MDENSTLLVYFVLETELYLFKYFYMKHVLALPGTSACGQKQRRELDFKIHPVYLNLLRYANLLFPS